MAEGPGKYNAWATMIRTGVHAEGVCLAVINGVYGSGFSVQGTREVHLNLPTVLRQIADEIEKYNEKETTDGI